MKRSVFAGLALLVMAGSVAARADTPPKDICAQAAAAIRAQKTPAPISAWPGIETEKVINTIGNGTPFHTVLQSDKARLLKEAQANDPTRVDLWQILLASNEAEQDGIIAQGNFQSMEVRELHSQHMGRLVLNEGGDLSCTRVSTYVTGRDGKVHIPVQAAAPADMDGADSCEADEHDAFYRWQGQTLDIDENLASDVDGWYTVSLLTGDNRWTPQCRIHAIYPFVYKAKAFDIYGARSAAVVDLASPYNVFLAAQADVFGHAYRSYYDNSDLNSRDRIQQNLFKAYAGRHSGVDLEAFKAAVFHDGIYVTADDLFFPVEMGGQTYMVTALQGWLRGQPQPNIEFEMYRFENGKAVLVGGIDSDRVPGVLESLTVLPL